MSMLSPVYKEIALMLDVARDKQKSFKRWENIFCLENHLASLVGQLYLL